MVKSMEINSIDLTPNSKSGTYELVEWYSRSYARLNFPTELPYLRSCVDLYTVME